jgi:hypothetical protein
VARVLGREDGDAVPYVGDESDDEIVQLVDAVRGHARSLMLLAKEVMSSGVRQTTSDLRGILEKLHDRYPADRERSLLAALAGGDAGADSSFGSFSRRCIPFESRGARL